METGSRKVEAILGAIVIGVLALFVWLSFAVGGGAPSGAKSYALIFDSALGLAVDNAVAVAGVKVGVVSDIGIDGRNAKVTVAIDPNVTVFENGSAAVRSKTLLGEKYIDLDPGAKPAKALSAGGTLHNNERTVDIDEVIREAATLVKSLNVIAPPLEKAVMRIDHLLQKTDGENVTDELARTIADAGELIRDTNDLVNASADDLRFLLRMGRDRGPEILQRVEQAAERVDRILAAVDPDDLKAASAQVKPTMDEVQLVVADLRGTMKDLRAASSRIESIMVKADRTLSRAEAINERAIREFLQVEGVRVNFIPDAKVERRVRKLRNESSPLPAP